ncbi:hypothetical protein QFZ61_002561 [Arthrobacter sp. B3I4]|nr:hypothetical protein [Arthrobacter sp. B3I4]
MEFLPDSDGMAWYNTYLPADTAAGIWERTTATARALQSPTEGRNLTQLRADVTADLLLTGEITGSGSGSSNGTDGNEIAAVTITGTGTGAESGNEIGTGASWSGSTGSASGSAASGVRGAGLLGDVRFPRAQVLVTVPVLSLLGFTEEPAMLDGYGPIPPSMARRLVAGGTDSMYRVLVDPRDGAPLEIGRKSYRPSKALRQWLRLRDAKCSFPGCNNASLDNETDHLLAWADGGTTGITNLGQACRKHHGLKHTTAWTPTGASRDHPPGWTSPTGRTYPSEHQDWEPPRMPDGLLPADSLAAESLTAEFPIADPLVGSEPPRDPGGHEPGRGLRTPPDPAPGYRPAMPPDPDPGLEWDLRPAPEPDFEPDLEFDPPPDPGPDPNLTLPEDPFPDWYLFVAA